jgi:hypothetical protein
MLGVPTTLWSGFVCEMSRVRGGASDRALVDGSSGASGSHAVVVDVLDDQRSGAQRLTTALLNVDWVTSSLTGMILGRERYVFYVTDNL